MKKIITITALLLTVGSYSAIAADKNMNAENEQTQTEQADEEEKASE